MCCNVLFESVTKNNKQRKSIAGQQTFFVLFRNETIFVVQWSHISKSQHDGNLLRKNNDVDVGIIFGSTTVTDMDPSYKYGGKSDENSIVYYDKYYQYNYIVKLSTQSKVFQL